jgi:hypothetical protein
MDNLISTIQAKNIAVFREEWNAVKDSLSEAEKQTVLTEILDYYSDNEFGFFVKVFDELLKSKLSLNFNTGKWTPTFLSLVADQASVQLFDYFVRKGADINFIGDYYANDDDKSIKREVEEYGDRRYVTCLDFLNNKIADKFTTDYNFTVPKNNRNKHWTEIDENEKVLIQKQTYYYLIEQAEYLKELIFTDKIIDHIVSLGGKTSDEIVEDSGRKRGQQL